MRKSTKLLSFVASIFLLAGMVSGEPFMSTVHAFEGVTENNNTLADEVFKKCTIEGKKSFMYAVENSSNPPKLVEVSLEDKTSILEKGGQIILVTCEMSPVQGLDSTPSTATGTEKITSGQSPKTLEIRIVKYHSNISSDVNVLPKRMRVWTDEKKEKE